MDIKELKIDNTEFIDLYFYDKHQIENIEDGKEGDLIYFREYEDSRFTGYFKVMRINKIDGKKIELEEVDEELDEELD